MKRFIFILFLIFSTPVFGYDFKDMCRKIAPTDEAINSILNGINSFGIIEIDSNIEGFNEFLRDRINSDVFYFGDLYKSSYFRPINNGYRALTLQHIRKSGSDKIEIISQMYDQVDVRNSGEYVNIQEFGVKKNRRATIETYPSYSVNFRSKEAWEHAGDMTAENITTDIFKIIDPSNIQRIEAPASPLHKNLKKETRLVMNDFNRTFPNLSALIDRYIKLDQFIKIKKKNNTQYTHLKLEPAVKLKILKKDYPEYADYMEKTRNNIKFRVAVKNKRGNTYFKIFFSSTKAILECYTYSGELIPFDSKGNPVFQESGTLDTEEEIIIEAPINIDFFGLKININNTILCKHHSETSKEILNFKIDKLNYSYSGMLLGFIPISVLKVLLPIDIDQFANDLVYVILNANNGQGSIATVWWESDESEHKFSGFSASTELLDHYFIRYFTKYTRGLIDTEEGVAAQSDIFQKKFLTAFLIDIKTVFTDLRNQKSSGVKIK